MEPENRHTCSVLAGIHPFREVSKSKRLDSALAVSVDERVRFDEFGAIESPPTCVQPLLTFYPLEKFQIGFSFHGFDGVKSEI
jgi:hypothetical protein